MKESLADIIRHRAGFTCEYCRLEQDNSVVPFEIDHIIALKHRGPTIEENLALACFFCNSFKGTDIATLDPATRKLTRLFNPRMDDWPQHFSMQGALINGLSDVGRSTVFLLSMNNKDAVRVRQAVLDRRFE